MFKKLGKFCLLTMVLLLIMPQLFASTLDTELLEKYKQGWSQLDQWNLFDAATVDILALEAGSLGSDGHWTNTGTAITLDAAPAKFIATYSSGQLLVTILDTNDITGTTYDQTIDLGTDASIIFGDNSDTFTINLDGNDVLLSTSDGSIELYPQADATEGTVDILTGGDVNDFIYFKTTADVPIIATSGSCNLEIAPDGGTVAVTGILTVSSTMSVTGATTVTSLIIGDETYDVVIDDEHRFTSNDNDVVVESYATANKDALFQLTSDAAADNGDEWQFKNDDGDSNKLLFINDTSGSLVTKLTLAANGLITTINDINIVNDTSSTNVVQDLLKLTSSSTGTGAAGLGAGLVVHIDDVGGVEEQASIDFTLTDASDGTEDCDIIFSQNINGAIVETVRFDADDAVKIGIGLNVCGATELSGDVTMYQADLTITDASLLNSLIFDTSAGDLTVKGHFVDSVFSTDNLGACLIGNFSNTGNIYIGDVLKVTGNTELVGNLSVDGDLIDADGNLDINAEGGTLALQSNGSDILIVGSGGACVIGKISTTLGAYIGGNAVVSGTLKVDDGTCQVFSVDASGNVAIKGNLWAGLKAGNDQAAAGAHTGELWCDENDDFTVKLGQ